LWSESIAKNIFNVKGFCKEYNKSLIEFAIIAEVINYTKATYLSIIKIFVDAIKEIKCAVIQ